MYNNKKTSRIYGGKSCKNKWGEKQVNIYELDERIFEDKNLNVKKFEFPSKEWVEFVLNNRNRDYKNIKSKKCNLDNKYDLVGPVADDDIVVLLRNYVNGLVDMNILIKELTYKELTNQYSFHTKESLKYLKGV